MLGQKGDVVVLLHTFPLPLRMEGWMEGLELMMNMDAGGCSHKREGDG